MTSDKTRRRNFLKSAGAASILSLAGCTGQGPSNEATEENLENQDGSTVVRFFSERSGAEDTFNKIAEEFKQEKGYDDVEIEFVFTQKGQGAEEKLQQMEAAGDVPEIQWVTSLDMYNNYQQEKVEPVTEVVESLGVPDVANIDGFGSLYVPIVREPLSVLYRTDIYEDGLPETKSGWLEAASGVGDMNGVAITSGSTNHATTQTIQYLWDYGVQHYEGTPGDINIVVNEGENRERAIEAFSWMKEMHSSASPRASEWEWGDVGDAFVQNNIASASALISPLTVESNRPDLIENLGVAPFPQRENPSSMDRLWCYFEGLSVRRDSENIELAKEFIEFFPTAESYLEMFTTEPLWQWPIQQEQVEELRQFDLYDRWEFLLNYVLDTWDQHTVLTIQGDDGALVPSSSSAYVGTTWGEVAAQLLIADRSPEEAVDLLAEELQSAQDSIQ